MTGDRRARSGRQHKVPRVPQRFGTHYECATALCSTSDANGTVHEASLATLGSIEENLWLLGALSLQGKDLWIGLYRGETDAAQATAAGNSTFASTWRWASGHRSGESLNAWRTGQPDARFGREDCGFISGSTGEWEDFACDLREMRCLCELGNSATAAYRETMRSHAEAMRATSKDSVCGQRSSSVGSSPCRYSMAAHGHGATLAAETKVSESEEGGDSAGPGTLLLRFCSVHFPLRIWRLACNAARRLAKLRVFWGAGRLFASRSGSIRTAVESCRDM